VVVHALEKAGITITQSDSEVPEGLGLIVFGEITPRLAECVSVYSQNGLNRVLTVATSHEVLASQTEWRLLKAGACDVVQWKEPARSARMVAAYLERLSRIEELVTSPIVQNNLVGKSRVALHCLRQVVETAYLTDASVLLMGESGTGKELAARLIHTLDPRPTKRDLVVVDCATIVPTLAGSEFFGHERGAFTGAVSGRDGAFALANEGTLFLDEIGELPPDLQAQLLRVLQERSYKRVGGNTWHHTEFRLVCATNRNLTEEVSRGTFRSDLYYRIAGAPITMPSLRERTEDILPLATHFMQQLRPDKDPPDMDPGVRTFL
jgi:transcriptional regulator with GAF, ATPase, and Fis domain